MVQIRIGTEEYTFVKDFKDNSKMRKSFNSLTKITYGFDFESWYQGGYWGEKYIPYSLAIGDEIVANASVSVMECMVFGESKKYIQIGTVMTATEYRKRGLSQYLMETILDEWKDACDMVYLFANDSVLDFYPKFGFIPVMEYCCTKAITSSNKAPIAESLNMELTTNKELLLRKSKAAVPQAKLSVLANTGLLMFYGISFLKNNVYYIKALDTIIIADYEGDTLHLMEVLSDSHINLNDVIAQLATQDTKKVLLGFIPNDTQGWTTELRQEEDTTLFVLEQKKELFQQNMLMFPILSHA